MKVEYSPIGDVMYIKMNDNIIVTTKQIAEGVYVDIDPDGKLVGIELLDVSTFVDDPESVSHETTGIATEKPDPEKLAARREATAKARRAKKRKVKEN